ncbi:hypothetical protein [Nostoc sp.]|uniref:hypothetical protein n=1 Tax=Nostoc sp. TaxID=1180 RepID=UPI002FF5D6A1
MRNDYTFECVLGLWQTAMLMRFVRSEILENIHQDYVRTAYAHLYCGTGDSIRFG